ncbi:amidase family protein, partial [Burkholderia contaminans]|uniref:amidase family protein n=1 Tax=Burkholderia contaminans TaxID=488447 RepID=UPI001A2B441A
PETLLLPLAAAPGDAADNAWITRVSEPVLARQLDDLRLLLAAAGGDRARLPLYGVPFAIKDNIDAAGWPTTAACPEFAYTP